MKIIAIQPKDIHITFEISLEDAERLIRILRLAKVEYDGNDPEQVKAADYLENKFCKTLHHVVEDLKSGS